MACSKMANLAEQDFPTVSSLSTALISISNQFKPNIVKRIIFTLNPADAVICINSHWQFRSAACQQIHFRLAAPKFGVLLLKWPLCFHNSQDIRGLSHYDQQNRFLHLLWDAVLSSVPGSDSKAATTQVHVFLAGYESMLLHEVGASVPQYGDLTTLMLDFQANDDFPPLRAKKFNDSRLQRICNTDTANKCGGGGVDMFMADPNMWAHTVMAVTEKCAATLSHFLFCVRVYGLHLPKSFYAGLKIDVMLAKMQNLQTLGIEPVDYELAKTGAVVSKQSWKTLHNLPESARLPNLKRIILNTAKDLVGKDSKFSVGAEPVSGLPDFPKKGVVVEVTTVPGYRAYMEQNIVFPDAQFIEARKARKDGDEDTDVVLHDPNSEIARSGYQDIINTARIFRFMPAEFTDRVIQYANDFFKFRNFHVSDSVLRDMRAAGSRGGSTNFTPTLNIWLDLDPTLPTKNAFPVLCDLLERQAGSNSGLLGKIRLVLYHCLEGDDYVFEHEIKEDEKVEMWRWDAVRWLLPYFADNWPGRYNGDMPAEVRDAMRIVMTLDNETLRDRTTEWHEKCVASKHTEEELSLFERAYKFPKLVLTSAMSEMHNEHPYEAFYCDSLHECWAMELEKRMKMSIKKQIQDAVAVGESGGLRAAMCQSLVRWEFKFTFTLPNDKKVGKFETAPREEFLQTLKMHLFKKLERLKKLVLHDLLGRTSGPQCGESSTAKPSETAFPSLFKRACPIEIHVELE